MNTPFVAFQTQGVRRSIPLFLRRINDLASHVLLALLLLNPG
jgi:hypothetical protein